MVRPSLFSGIRETFQLLFQREAIPMEYRDEIYNQLLDVNLQRAFISGIMLVFLELSNLLFDSLITPHQNLKEYYTALTLISLAGIILFILLISYAYQQRSTHPVLAQNITFVFWASVVLMGLAFVFLDMLDTQSGKLANVLFIPFILSIVPLFSASRIVPLSLFFNLSTIVFVFVLQRSYIFLQYALIGAVLCYMISKTLYHSYVSTVCSALDAEAKNLQLDALSKTDQLTKLPNRRSLDTFLQIIWNHCFTHQVPMMVMILDIDYFKDYNDTYGHLAGDDCLVKIAEELRENTSGFTDYLGRFGGEEFMIISDHVSEEGVQKFSALLRCEVENMELHPDPALTETEHVTISIGAAILIPGESFSLKDLVLRADQALYQAKKGGRNRSVLMMEMEGNQRWIL